MDKKYIIYTNSKTDEFTIRDEERNLDYAHFMEATVYGHSI